MEIVKEISEYLQKGRMKNVKALVAQAIEENIPPEKILNEGLLAGMTAIGVRFKRDEVCVPEVLVAARAMNAGLALLEPKLAEAGAKPIGKAVIGTIQGDLHDIGKNLVVMMLKGAGMEIYDLGVDIAPETFADRAEEIGADIIGVSALLTTTMTTMGKVIEVLEERGIRKKYVVMVGGAPVNESFAEEIGADYYTPDAASAAEKVKEIMKNKGLSN